MLRRFVPDVPVERKYGNAVLVTVMALLFIFFIFQTLFNSKGEPREAIVAVSMLNSGDWILPESFGSDIPYKPPFLAWCIALVSLLFNGGMVTEFTARFPSVVAAAILVVSTNRFFRNNSGSQLVGAATAWVTISSLEVFRAATACRVDMMLTMFMVCACYVMFTFFKRGCRGGLPWGAILLMAGGALTKGPVAIFLPCLIMGIYRLLCHDRFWPLFGRLVATGLLACLLPALWYWAAWMRGGERFFSLMVEENILRLTGKMSYASHENPVYYNFLTLLGGMAPYTLLALMALFAVNRRKCVAWFKQLSLKRLNIAPLTLFALTAAVTVLVFYSLPKSKRSVYLLPMYPFLSYFVVQLIGWLSNHRPVIMKVFTRIMAMITIVVPVVYGLLATGALSSVKAVAKLGFDQSVPTISLCMLLGLIVVFVGVGSWRGTTLTKDERPRLFSGYFGDAAISIFATYLMLNIAVLPSLLSAKSDRDEARRIESQLDPGENLYSYVSAYMHRFFTVNFYLNDRVRLFDNEFPSKGKLLVGEKDFEEFKDKYGKYYRFKVIFEGTKKSCDVKQPIIVVEFSRK